MTARLTVLIYPVTDLSAAQQQMSAALGIEPSVTSPYYVGYDIDGAHIGLDPSGHHGHAGPVPYLQVDDIDAAVLRATHGGATVVAPVHEVGGGRRVAIVHLEDQPLGFTQDAPSHA